MISPGLCELLVNSDHDEIIQKILAKNPDRVKFTITGLYEKLGNSIDPILLYSDEKLEETDYSSFIYESLNSYICSVLENPSFYSRPKPWLKPHQDFNTDSYKEYEINHKMIKNSEFSTQKMFLGCEVNLIQTLFTNQMIIPKELFFLLSCHHPFIIHSFGYTVMNNSTYLVLAYYSQTLENLILTGNLKEQDRVCLMIQATSLVWFLQTKKVVNLSLLPSEIFINLKNNEIVVCNFSKAEVVNEVFRLENENFPLNETLNIKNDSFSLGYLLYFIYKGQHYKKSTYLESDFDRLIDSLVSENIELRPAVEDVYKFLQNLLAQ